MSIPVRRALYGQLTSGGSSLRTAGLGDPAPGYTWAIYYQEAPQGALYPFVIFSKSSGVPTEAFHDPSALETDVWMVKAVDRDSSSDRAEAIADAIKTLLNDQTLSISWQRLPLPPP